MRTLLASLLVMFLRLPEVRGDDVTNVTYGISWMTSSWSPCELPVAGECCRCERIRNVSCIWTPKSNQPDVLKAGHLIGPSDHVTVPPFYCTGASSAGVEPASRELCDSCSRGCVVSDWGPWSECSATCGVAARHRQRRIILPHTPGHPRKCPSLIDRRACPEIPPCPLVTDPEYVWRVGPWTGCHRESTSSVRSCVTGSRRRVIQCVNRIQLPVPDIYCGNWQGRSELRPRDQEPCDMPCDCRLSDWSDWSTCSITCHHSDGDVGQVDLGQQTRYRTIRRDARNGGVGCAPLRESRVCVQTELPPCIRYRWHSEAWNPCHLAEGSSTTACGQGTQHRSVYCIVDGDTTFHQVPDYLCNTATYANSSELVAPPTTRVCHVTCATDCQLGEWENWSSCTESCGGGGVRLRKRPELVSASKGGADCGERFQFKTCEPTPCFWWHTSRWSNCFVESPAIAGADCGVGKQVRNVYCISAMDDIMEDTICANLGIPKPTTETSCVEPCAHQCSLSGWSDWGQCTATCGAQGGIQSRTRQIIDNMGASEPCVDQDHLLQTRVCNRKPCLKPLWQIGAWSECTVAMDDGRICGNNTGVQSRDVYCAVQPEYPVKPSRCDVTTKPAVQRQCNARCPVDCVLSDWSDWSMCSQNCLVRTVKTRTKYITQLSQYGGEDCPIQADHNGMIVQSRVCRRPSTCYNYSWEVTDWDVCLTLTDCGHGYQTRNVSCVRSDGKNVREGLCHSNVEGYKPIVVTDCYVACTGDCRLSQWTEFGQCSQTCGATSGIRTRSRTVINAESVSQVYTDCGHLDESTLTDTEECGQRECPTYRWDEGRWSSCIIHGSDASSDCGSGVQRRHVLCLRADGVHVPNHFCDVINDMPPTRVDCHVPCARDCVLSDWGAWENCTAVCGHGMQFRFRSVLHESSDRGRPCGVLFDSRVCHVRDCEQLDWTMSEWGDCVPTYERPCGRGHQRRTVTCPAGEEFDDLCWQRADKPALKEHCYVPCLGDCQLSDWSEFTSCDCSAGISTKTRRRHIEVAPLPSARQCDSLIQRKRCVCPEYRIQYGDWSSCELQGNGTTCGTGIRHRVLNCLNIDNGLQVSLSLCDVTGVVMSESCEVSCPRDCQLGPPGPWEACVEPCGMMAIKRRTRNVVVHANKAGRPCPAEETENTTCPTTYCQGHSWSRGMWSECSTRYEGCGVGYKSRTITCKSSDGVVTDERVCLQAVGLDFAQELSELDEQHLSAHDLHRELSCGVSCPGDCVVTPWSAFSSCFTNCSDGSSSQLRSRAILQTDTGGKTCPENMLESRSCAVDRAQCPVFHWRAELWKEDGSRDVDCLAKDSQFVDGGCVDELRPSSEKRCLQECAEYGTCKDGKCFCLQGFTGDGLVCLPVIGCASDEHCLFNGTTCDQHNKECVCTDGILPDEHMRCPSFYLSSANQHRTVFAGLLLYAVLGSICAFLLLAVLLVIALMRKKQGKNRSMLSFMPAVGSKTTYDDDGAPPLPAKTTENRGAGTGSLTTGSRSLRTPQDANQQDHHHHNTIPRQNNPHKPEMAPRQDSPHRAEMDGGHHMSHNPHHVRFEPEVTPVHQHPAMSCMPQDQHRYGQDRHQVPMAGPTMQFPNHQTLNPTLNPTRGLLKMTTFKPTHQDDAGLHHDDFSSPNSPVSSVAGDVLPYIKRLSASDSGRGSSASDSGGSQNGDPYAALPTLNENHASLQEATSDLDLPSMGPLTCSRPRAFPPNNAIPMTFNHHSHDPSMTHLRGQPMHLKGHPVQPECNQFDSQGHPKGEKLLQYCDELIAELETMAKN